MILVSYIIFLLLIGGIFYIERFIVKSKWHTPLNLFLVFMLLYVSPLTLRYIYKLPIEGNVTRFFDEIEGVYHYGLLATGLSIAFFYLTYKISPVFFWIKKLAIKSKKIEKMQLKYQLSAYLLLIIGSLLFLKFSMDYGGVLDVLLIGYAVTEVFAENPLFALSLSMVMTSSIFLLLSYQKTRKRIFLFNSLMVLLISTIVLVIMGRRAEIVVWNLTYLVMYCLLIKHISFQKILPLILLSFIFLNILGFARQSNYDSLESITNNLQEQYSNLDNDKTGLFYTITTGQFVVPYETIPILVDKMAYDEMYYGSTLFNVVLQWIPRSIWSNKEYGNGVWFYQKYYDASALPNEGRQFFFLAEGYMNFGILGMIIWSILWGIFWKNINFLGCNNLNISGLSAYIYSIYISGMIILIPSDSVGMFVSFPKSYLLWFLLGYVLAYLFRK